VTATTLVIAGMVIGTYGAPDFATLLTVACPLVWITAGAYRTGLVGNTILSV
jgi:hypothetical protein